MAIRMLTGTAAREDSTSSRAFVDLVPTPGHVFTTTRSGTITALLVCECRVSTQRTTAHLTVRITIDGEEIHPGPAVLTTHDQYETRPHLAFKAGVPAGQHTVTVQWKVSSGKAYVRNRSFTVWIKQ